MSGEHDRIYDSFVIRVWHDGTIEELRRVEVEHVQTGEAVSAASVSLAWILAQVRALLLTTHFPDDPSARPE